MKYNSIGEQLIAKAKELDPSYTPDKFNDMSEALDVILNKTGGSSAINLDDYIDSETLTLKSEELHNELVTRVIINKETFGYLTFGEQTIFVTLYAFNGVLMLQGMINLGFEQLVLLKCPALGEGLQIEVSPYGIPLIDLANPISTPRIVSYDNNVQNDLAIGDGLTVENGVLKTNNIPALPSDASTKAYTLQTVNGVLTWTSEESIVNNLTLPQTAPSSQLIPSITTSNEQQNLTVGDGLVIENGVIKEDIIEINVSFELTQEDLQAGGTWKSDVGTIDEGKKIWNSINSSTGLPKKAIINISLNLLGNTQLYKVLANPFKNDFPVYGYNFNVGGFTDASSYLFVFGAIYIESKNDTIDAHLGFNQNLVQ